MDVKIISAEDTLNLRNQILRPGKSRADCIFEGDHADSTCHFGVLDRSNNIVGIVSVYQKSHDKINDKNVYQLRSMAVAPSYRGSGLGVLLLKAAEAHVKLTGAKSIWANARSSALGFYLQQDYQALTDEFLIEGVGHHYLVTKRV